MAQGKSEQHGRLMPKGTLYAIWIQIGRDPYVVSVEYKGLFATSEKFVLKVGERREDLILKLSVATPVKR